MDLVAKRLVWIAALVAGLSTVACSRSKAWSCENRQRHACSEWSAGTTTNEVTSRQRDACLRMGGVLSDGPCATAGAVGACEPGPGSTEGRMVFYSPRDPGDAQRVCGLLSGTWKPM
jgi:hypothetical protein